MPGLRGQVAHGIRRETFDLVVLGRLRQHLQQEGVGRVALAHPSHETAWDAQREARIVDWQQVGTVAEPCGLQEFGSVGNGISPQLAPVGVGWR